MLEKDYNPQQDKVVNEYMNFLKACFKALKVLLFGL